MIAKTTLSGLCQFPEAKLTRLKPVTPQIKPFSSLGFRFETVEGNQWRAKPFAKISSAAAKTAVKISAEAYQYPWREKLQKYKYELAKGVWGSWHLGAWKPLAISARKRGRFRKEVLLAGEDWPYDPLKREMRTKRKGHKVDHIAAEKRANTAELIKKMLEMLLDYKKRAWEKGMKAEEAKD